MDTLEPGERITLTLTPGTYDFLAQDIGGYTISSPNDVAVSGAKVRYR